MTAPALVTGASRGIGRAVALALGRGGHPVGCAYRSDDVGAKETAAMVEDGGGEALAVAVDVVDTASVDAAFATVEEAYGPVLVAVANAGVVADGLTIRMSDDQWQTVIDTDLTGAFHTFRRGARAMVRARQGRLVAISSVSGHVGTAGQANYAAAKAGLLGLSRSMARELAGRGITVNVVAPGPIDTDMTRDLGDEWRQATEAAVPAGRLGTPEDVAETVAFLCSDRAAYVTGALIPVDGGLGMGH